MLPAGFDVLMFLDPSLCSSDRLTDLWVGHSRRIFATLAHSGLLFSILLTLAIAPWFVRSLRRLRWASRATWLMLAFYLLINTPAFTPALISWGSRSLVQFLPEDTGQKADAIVILGRGREWRPQRVEAAVDLWKHHRAGLIFASGRGDAREMMRTLKQQGIPETAMDGESCSRTTAENAEYTVAQLKPRGVRNIILITDPPHMLRSLLTFRSFGFQVIPHLSELPSSMDGERFRSLLVHEWMGLFGYGLQGRYFPRTG